MYSIWQVIDVIYDEVAFVQYGSTYYKTSEAAYRQVKKLKKLNLKGDYVVMAVYRPLNFIKLEVGSKV